MFHLYELVIRSKVSGTSGGGHLSPEMKHEVLQRVVNYQEASVASMYILPNGIDHRPAAPVAKASTMLHRHCLL